MMSSDKLQAIHEELNAPFELTPEQIQFYNENGFIKLNQVFSPQLLAYYQPFIEQAVDKADKTPLEDDEAYASAFIQIINLWRTDPDCKEFVFGKRLARIAAQLMQVQGVRIYHDQALFKAPGGGHTPWHCDQFYWPLSNEKTVTAWCPLVQVPANMGYLEFAAGSHKKDLGRAVGIGKESDECIGKAVKEGDYEVVGEAFALGDVSFHAGFTFHRADANTSENCRKVMTIIFMDKDIRMTQPVNSNQQADVERYLEGVAVGEVCKGPRNPLIWEENEEAGAPAGPSDISDVKMASSTRHVRSASFDMEVKAKVNGQEESNKKNGKGKNLGRMCVIA